MYGHEGAAPRTLGLQVWATDDVTVGGYVLCEPFDGSPYQSTAKFDVGKVLSMDGLMDTDTVSVEYMEIDT